MIPCLHCPTPALWPAPTAAILPSALRIRPVMPADAAQGARLRCVGEGRFAAVDGEAGTATTLTLTILWSLAAAEDLA